MKRTPLKRGSSEMKRTPLKRGAASSAPKKKKVTKPITKAKKEAWRQMSRYIRLRDSRDGHATCVSCGKVAPITGTGCMQAGHFIPGRGNSLIYDERNCQPQCVGCNMWQQGKWVEYEEWMIRRYGRPVVEELKLSRHNVKQMKAEDHDAMAAYFKQKVIELGGWPGDK